MKGCSKEFFTCNNGDCVKMEHRCDQILNCPDESDEINCKTIILKKSYRKASPPVVLLSEQKNIQKASVRVTLTLLDIAEIKESHDEIYIKFTTELE